jgi:hypothetical protein
VKSAAAATSATRYEELVREELVRIEDQDSVFITFMIAFIVRRDLENGRESIAATTLLASETTRVLVYTRRTDDGSHGCPC